MDALSDKESKTTSGGNPQPAGSNGADRSLAMMQRLFEPVRSDLESVDNALISEMRSDDSFVDEVLRHGVRIGGKRLRPALLLLVARSLGNVSDAHLTLAVVIEMIHTATLVHDDVLDGADHRRHLPTHRSLWGNEASVLTGDFLFSRAFHLASTMETTHACREIGAATNTVCEGEMRQIGTCNNFDLTEAEYFEIVEAKTAALCATAAYLGAFYSDASRAGQFDDTQLNRIREYGRLLGIAFQIIDDVLDISGSEARVGKSLGTDLQQLKPTLPLIHLLSSVDDDQRNRLTGLLSNPDSHPTDELLQAMKEQDSINYANEKAEAFAAMAVELIEDLPAGNAKDSLLAIPRFVVRRRH